MAVLQDLPTELLVDIYQRFNNIDDALHLARCSKRLHVIFDDHRLRIFRTIILTSSIHIYDVTLCWLQELFQAFSSSYLKSPHHFVPVVLRPPSISFALCFYNGPVSDQQIWDIVARWQGLKPLQHLYLNPVIQSKYTESRCVTGANDPQKVEMLDIMKLARSGTETNHTNNEISARFYTALTAFWVATESRKLAQQCSYTFQSTENSMFDLVISTWEQREDLQESLDVLEVCDFVYGFLCRHVDGVDFDSFTDWIDDDWLCPELSRHKKWTIFIKDLWMVLDPSDVLDLLYLTSAWRDISDSNLSIWTREMRRDYLRLRGLFDSRPPHRVKIIDVDEARDIWFSVSDLELACELQLRRMFPRCSYQVEDAWARYRATLWQKDARGRFGQMPSTTVVDFIRDSVSGHHIPSEETGGETGVHEGLDGVQ